MARKPKGEIRRSQLITTYGVGSIIAVEDESFMVAGIDRWEPGRRIFMSPAWSVGSR